MIRILLKFLNIFLTFFFKNITIMSINFLMLLCTYMSSYCSTCKESCNEFWNVQESSLKVPFVSVTKEYDHEKRCNVVCVFFAILQAAIILNFFSMLMPFIVRMVNISRLPTLSNNSDLTALCDGNTVAGKLNFVILNLFLLLLSWYVVLVNFFRGKKCSCKDGPDESCDQCCSNCHNFFTLSTGKDVTGEYLFLNLIYLIITILFLIRDTDYVNIILAYNNTGECNIGAVQSLEFGGFTPLDDWMISLFQAFSIINLVCSVVFFVASLVLHFENGH